MKRIRNVLVLLVVAAMALSLFAGCVNEQEVVDALAGTWTIVVDDTEEQAQALLENIDLYEEEIAFADLASLDYVQNVTFDAEKNYSFGFDVAATKECVREFYLGVFAAIYENRASLNDVYSMEFDAMSEDEFYQFYADLYTQASYDEFITYITDIAYDYETLSEPWETGTFTVSGDDLMCTITGESQAEALGYEIDGNTLTLTYSNAVEVYTRG